jgi:hypothetical protein
MDQSTLDVLLLILALVAVVAGVGGAVIALRARSARGLLGAEVGQLRRQVEAAEDEVARLKDAVGTLTGGAAPAPPPGRRGGADPHLEDVAGAVDDLADDLRLATERADGLDARIRLLEGRLRDLASEPPPIPSGRRPGRVEDLRAVLRAQAAAEAAQAAQSGEASQEAGAGQTAPGGEAPPEPRTP